MGYIFVSRFDKKKQKKMKLRFTKRIQIYEKTGPNSSLLFRTSSCVDAGEVVNLGPVKTMTYDHRDKLTVSFFLYGMF